MAGETALSSASTTGVYILQDNNGWVAANTPNTCNLEGDTGLVLATSYMYFELFNSLVHQASTPRDGSTTGWRFWQNGTTLNKTKASTGQGQIRTFNLEVQVSSTQQQNWEKFFDYHQQIKWYQLYLVRQTASTTFKQFSYNATLYKYTPIVLTSYQITEVSSPGNEFQKLNIVMQQADRISVQT